MVSVKKGDFAERGEIQGEEDAITGQRVESNLNYSASMSCAC